jgi:DNA mismatch repair ATPase MutL
LPLPGKLVDLHAAREQVFIAQWYAGRNDSQPLLIPETITVSPAIADGVEHCQSDLAGIGIHIDRRDHERIVIRQLPSILVNLSPELLVRRLGDHMQQGFDGDRFMHHLIRDAACMPVSSLTSESLAALLRELAATAEGAAAVLPLDAAQLSHLFARP